MKIDPRRARLERNFWWIFAVVGAGNFLGPLSGSIVTVALPAIANGFHVDLQSVKWVVLSYLMVATFILPIAGKLGQRFGEGRIYTVGFVIYCLGTIACALSEYGSLSWLVAARALQATGSGLVFSVGGALVTRYVPSNRRGLAFGLVGSIVGLALISGPVLGGVLSAIGWPWIFWAVVPVTVAGVIGCLVILPQEHTARQVAIPGLSSALWIAIVVGATLIGEAFSKGLWQQYLWLTLTLFALAIFAFSRSERRAPQLFDYSLLRDRVFRMAATAGVLNNVALFAVIVFLPFYLENYRRLGLMHTGLLLSISPIVSVLIGASSGHLADRIGYRPPIIGGLLVCMFAYLTAALALQRDSLLILGIALGLIGLGGTLFGGPNFAALMGSVPPEKRPLASSFGSMTRNMGFLAGTSVGAVLFGLLLWHYGGHALMLRARTEELQASAVPAPAFAYAFTGVLLGCALLMAIANRSFATVSE